ncbi:cytochrome P450 [Streptomyces sp. NPDC048590]|uniref:cytochrome P450 n=1 Tax=Streptomyces sp. NPDC048590 TaxID=3365574 RepID=UPI003717BF8D
MIVQDPELIRTMLTDLGPSLDKGRFFEKMGQLLGDSVVTAAGQEHVRKRRQLQPAFGRPKIAHYVDLMGAEADITRRTVTPTRLGPWSIPADTELAYCQHALHRDPALFPAPLTFDPDRWLDAAQVDAIIPGAFLPFGAGKHKCIGDRFALTELVTAVATIIRRVRFDLPSHHAVVRPVAQATVRPGKLMMTTHERKVPGGQ